MREGNYEEVEYFIEADVKNPPDWYKEIKEQYIKRIFSVEDIHYMNTKIHKVPNSNTTILICKDGTKIILKDVLKAMKDIMDLDCGRNNKLPIMKEDRIIS